MTRTTPVQGEGRLRALDLFCKAGGATKGLQRAGFHVTGVDIEPQPHYCGDAFVLGDALTVPLDGYDFIWASPPCQRYSEATPPAARAHHPDLIAAVRQRLQPYPTWVIENVDGARGLLRWPFMLCGTMFGLPVWRHRWFEERGIPWWHRAHSAMGSCRHTGRPVVVSGRTHGGKDPSVDQMRDALGVNWMVTRDEIRQAIPPAYAEHVGRAAMVGINSRRAA